MTLLELAEDYNIMRDADGKVIRASIILDGDAYRKIEVALDHYALRLADVRINRLVNDKQNLLLVLNRIQTIINQVEGV